MVVGDIFNIEARVREIDPRLVVLFDYTKERYVVYETVRKVREEAETFDETKVYAIVDELMHVTTLENEDGSFRPLDHRLLHDLRRMDTRDIKDLAKHLRDERRKVRESQQRKRDEYTTDVIKHYTPLVKRELKYGL